MRLGGTAIESGEEKNRRREGRFNIFSQCLLVVLDGKKVVSASVNHGLCNGLLAEDRITGDNPVAQIKPGE